MAPSNSAASRSPDASITAIKGDKKHVTTTDENGRYAFPDLADGVWRIDIEMMGFAKQSNEVGIAFDAPAAEWTLKFLPLSEIKAPAAAAPAVPAPTISTAAPAATPDKPATTTTAAAPAATPAAGTTAPKAPAAQGRGAQGGRGQGGKNGRPSILGSNGFQRVDVNSSGDVAAASDTGLAANDMADMSSSADPSLMVNGSVSRGLDMPQQNDWFGGPGGRMDGMGGIGGPGGIGMNGMGMGGPGGDGAGRWLLVDREERAVAAGRAAADLPGAAAVARAKRHAEADLAAASADARRTGQHGRGGDRAGRGGPAGRAGVASFGNGRRDRRMQYNGNAAFTLDNSVWDARSYSINGQETPKAAYAKARANVTFGGPLKIPKLLSGQRGTFNINYSLGRTRNGTSSTQTMPTLLERTGDFSQSIGAQGPVTIYDPLTGSPFPGNVIPQNRLNSASLGLLKYYPVPNAPGYKYNYQAPITTIQNSDNLNTRLNQTLTKKDRINGGLAYMGSNNTTPNIFNFIDTGTARNISANVAYGHNFSTRLINNLRYTFSRSRNLGNPFFAYKENVASELGILGTSQAPQNWGPPTLSFTNYTGLMTAPRR